MSAPRDDRAHGRRPGDQAPQGRPGAAPGPGQAPDPYLEETYARDPYAQDVYAAQDPYGEGSHLHDPYAQGAQPYGYPQDGQYIAPAGQQGYPAPPQQDGQYNAPTGQQGYPAPPQHDGQYNAPTGQQGYPAPPQHDGQYNAPTGQQGYPAPPQHDGQYNAPTGQQGYPAPPQHDGQYNAPTGQQGYPAPPQHDGQYNAPTGQQGYPAPPQHDGQYNAPTGQQGYPAPPQHDGQYNAPTGQQGYPAPPQQDGQYGGMPPRPGWAPATNSPQAPQYPPPPGTPWDSDATQYLGVNPLVGGPAEYQQPVGEQYAPNWYGEATGGFITESTGTFPIIAVEPPLEEEVAEAAAAARKGGSSGKVSSLLSSSAVMAAGTLVSRGTGFLRTMVIVAAVGVGTMGDSYSAANVLPTMLYILVGGGALNAVFVPQLVRSMKNDADGGQAYANRLLTLVIVGLSGVVFVTVIAAPLLVRLVSNSLMGDPATADTTVALARYCLPTIFFMGVHVVMGQILNARGRFGAMMWTPVLNNIVVIFTFGAYIWVFGSWGSTHATPQTVSPEGVRLLGLGTLLGLVVQSLAMIPYLRDAGFRFRPRFDWRGHGLGHAARLARWTFLFVLANQAGFLVVTQLATAAGKAAEKHGYNGVSLAAYSNAQLIWQLPQAVITVSVMSAVLPRISRAAADGDAGAVRDDISYGLRTSAVAIVPAAFLFLALGPWIGSVIYGIGSGGEGGGRQIGFMLSAFALGLIPYSVQYVLLRGFYAYEDTRTPFSNTVWVAITTAAVSGICYLVLPDHWAVTGMAGGYGLAYVVGVLVAVPKLRRRLGDLDGKRIGRTYTRLLIACIPAAGVGIGVGVTVSGMVSGWPGNLFTLVVAGAAQVVVFFLIARRMHIEELNAMVGMVRGRLGR